MEAKWNQNGAQIYENVTKKTNTKRGAFPDTLFYRFCLILKLFLKLFSIFFMFFSKNSKKGRHAFGLRHGEWIEGRTFQNRTRNN